MNRVVLKNISKSYYSNKGTTDVIDDLTLDVKEGEIVAIVGPSGTGKSTILNIIAGLTDIDSGIKEVLKGLEISPTMNGVFMTIRVIRKR